jgi:LacI family transcriptional regulator
VDYTGDVSATRDDVARRAGVSVATVSYVLNGGPRGVSDEKRERVLRAVAELRYRPNAIARSLRARRTNILGLVLPDSANPYFAQLGRAIEDAAAEHGYQMVVSNAADDPAREAAQIEALLRLQVDGLVWVPADLRGEQLAVAESAVPLPPSIPTVQVDRELAGPRGRPVCDVVEADNTSGGRLAAEHLLSLGHARIACIAGPPNHQHARQRLDGARAALAERGIDFLEVRHGDFSYGSGAAVAAKWCGLTPVRRPTALLCINDAMALGALSAAADVGVRVPVDLSVTGYDDVPQARYAVPPLTTVAQPVQKLAATALATLLERIARAGEALHDRQPQRHVFPVRLVVRRSTARPAHL